MAILLNISITLALLILLVANTQGAPTKGRRIRGRPDSKNANCVTEKGTLNTLPLAANKKTKDESDDGSGTLAPFSEIGSRDPWAKDGRELGVFQPEEASTDLDGSPKIDYADFVFPQKVYQKDYLPSNQEFQEEYLTL